MFPTSSPVVYPASSSPPTAAKRPHQDPKPTRMRTQAGFLVDDDSDDDQDATTEPVAKKRMLSSPPLRDSTEPSSPPPPQIADHEKSASNAPQTIDTEPNASQKEPEYNALHEFLAASNASGSLSTIASNQSPSWFKVTTCSGRTMEVKQRKHTVNISYERMVAARSKTKEGRAKRSYYGIEIHSLIDSARKELAKQPDAPAPDAPMASIERQPANKKPKRSLLWTEKYRARNFMDLVGDDLTNRNVLRWLKRWDPLVFPGTAKSRSSARRGAKAQEEEEKPHRRILMLTGPPGLGKTTLAHVCARQAGYEVLEINASDDRSSNVVKTRIRTSLGTENVKTVQHKKLKEGEQQKVARPVCVVVDEVDGVVSGSGGSGEGGFIKALMDLITTGEKNAAGPTTADHQAGRKKKKGDDFKQMRPLILICNDVYHPSLRPLRQSSLAEVIHVGKPTIDAVVTRLKTVFDKEGIPCEKDAARKLCEAAWGMTSGIDAKKGAESTAEGDLRGIMVVGEWVAGRIRSATLNGPLCLTRHWVERHIVRDLAQGGGGARGVGRGNVRDIVTRIFQEGAGFPKSNTIVAAPVKHAKEQPQTQLGFSEQHKKQAMERLRQMIETSGDVDRIITDIFGEYPTHEFNDDSFLTKPDQAYEWMHFHDSCSSKLFGSQEWELAPYLSQPVLACHHLFASQIRRANNNNAGYDRKWGSNNNNDDGDDDGPPLPFSGPRADFAAREAEKENRSMLQAIHAQLTPTLMRSFRSTEDLAAEFLPYLVRLVSPDVKPVVVGGSTGLGTASVRKETEKAMVRRAAEVLADVGIDLQRGKIEDASPTGFSRGPQWVYRMEPDLDILGTYETSAAVVHGTHAPTRYAVRQVLDQELRRTRAQRENLSRQARLRGGGLLADGEDVDSSMDLDSAISKGKKKGLMNSAAEQLAAAAAAVPAVKVKKDFFGRVIKAPEPRTALQETDGNRGGGIGGGGGGGGKGERVGPGDLSEAKLGEAETKVWVTFHEGFSNAVRKPLSLDELLRGL